MALRQTNLTEFWWAEKDTKQRRDTVVPTNIHLDLLKAGVIPDPFSGMNERDVQWVHQREWVYGCNFKRPEPLQDSEGEHIDLVFEGLDTFAEVKLNGQAILTTDNMFVPHRLDVKTLLQDDNELEILFQSAYNKSEALRQEKGDLLCWNGHYGRVYVRKAQYHYGWDWGPSLVTCGPWKPVRLEQYSARVKEVAVTVELDKSLRNATVAIGVEAVTQSNVSVEVFLEGPNEQKLFAYAGEDGKFIFNVAFPALWYPHDLGDQPLYKAHIVLHGDGENEVFDRHTEVFGIRSIELVQDEDSIGSTFYFKVNGIPIFSGGSNWIPGDSFLPQLTLERYSGWIETAVEGNQNMIRIWGGGIYEDDAFYDECDRRGLLVWQDFCFACGQYPADESFRKSVEAEAVAAVKRLRNHPSLIIFAGNNEDYQIANEGLKHDMTMPEDKWLSSTFGARYTYEVLLPAVVKEHSSGIIYWPGSPFGGIDNNSDRTIGDVHIWNVSSGMLVPYQRYPDLTARFVSEFGMLSCPNLKTVEDWFFGQSKDRHPQSEAMEFHCKASSYEKRMFTCMGEQFRLSFELKRYIFLTQLLQSEAMGFAFRGWRREFKNRRCGGALVWQLNDCWPVSSWALVDYFGRRKPAYYTIKRALKPVTVGVIRRYKVNPRPNKQHEALCNGRTKADAAPVIAHATPHIYPPKESSYGVWVCNSQNKPQQITVELRFVSVVTGRDVRKREVISVTAKPTDTTEVFEGDTPEDESVVLAATLLNAAGDVISRECDWPQPLKHMTFPDRGLNVQHEKGEKILVTTQKPVKALVFQNADVKWSDNSLDVMPGDEYEVHAPGLETELDWLYYGIDD